MNYEEAIAFVERFGRSGAPVTDLSRIAGLLDRLGNPQNKMDFIHIAGTNGKGSVAEYLTRFMDFSDYFVGTFTSPHIRHLRDRIRILGQDISGSEFCLYCSQVAEACGDEAYSRFEILLAIALCYFYEEDVDIVVLEAGIGGLLDATNVIPPPLFAVITAISMDHQAVLGHTIEEIAQQKAGIIKPGSAVVMAPQPHEAAAKVITEKAKELGCSLHTVSRKWAEVLECGIEGNRFIYEDVKYTSKMGGWHQIDNALTALTVAGSLYSKGCPHSPNYACVIPGYHFTDENLQHGIRFAQVPGRIQVLQKDPLVILDGGHNADGVGALTDLLSESGIESWIGICGMTDQKDADAAAFQLALVLRKVLCVDGFAENALPAERLQEAFVRQHVMANPMPLEEALPYALKWAKGSHGAVVICGSLYLASWFLNRED